MTTTPQPTEADARRVAVGAFVGTALEWYDFFLYGTAASLVFNRLYFATGDPVVATLAAFIHAQLEPPRARVAHAQHIYFDIIQAQPQRIALDCRRGGSGYQTAKQRLHGHSIRLPAGGLSCRPCSA